MSGRQNFVAWANLKYGNKFINIQQARPNLVQKADTANKFRKHKTKFGISLCYFEGQAKTHELKAKM